MTWLLSLYMLPLGSILRKHGFAFHFYADDSQIDLPLKANGLIFVSTTAWLSLEHYSLDGLKIHTFKPRWETTLGDG